MIRDHVAQRARVFIISSALFDPDLLSRRNLYAVDVAPIPDELKDAVAETKDHDVLHRLFAKLLINAVDLAFVEDLFDFLLELLRRFQILANWFLDHGA